MTPYRLLLVDRSPAFLAFAAQCLGADPALEVVGSVQSGQAALTACEQLRPDLVLLEVALPDLRGLEVLQQIKACADAPLVAMLALDDLPEYQSEVMRAGADAFIPKPDLAQALPLIHRVLQCGARRKGDDDVHRHRAA